MCITRNLRGTVPWCCSPLVGSPFACLVAAGKRSRILVPTLDFSSLDFSLSLLLEFASCFSSDLSLSESLLESDDVSDDFVSELFVSLLGLELACLSELLE